MKKLRIIIPLLLVLIMSFTSSTFGDNYFLYDAEAGKILFMGENDAIFTEKIDCEKIPSFIMKTANPDKFLLLYVPEQKGKNAKGSNAGQITVFNISTGRTEDMIELGFAPFHWAYSQDHKQFFISYKPAPDSKTTELLQYNVEEQKSDKLSDFATEITDIQLAADDTKLFVLAQGSEKSSKSKTVSILLTVKFSPLVVQNTLSLQNHSTQMYALNGDRLILINKKSDKSQPESLTLINTQDNVVLQEQQLKPVETFLSWYQEQRVLIIASFETKYNAFLDRLTGTGQFYKVSANGIQFSVPSTPWIDYDYSPKTDCLDILTKFNLEVVDYKNSLTPVKYGTENNIYESSHKLYIDYKVNSA